MVSIIEWFNTFLPLSCANFCRICNFKESWCQFYEPLGIYDSDFAHILFCSHHKFMVDNPVRLSLEKRAAWVHVDWLILHHRPVTSLRVLSSCMEEETSSYSFSDLRKVLASTHNIQLVPVRKKQDLERKRM